MTAPSAGTAHEMLMRHALSLAANGPSTGVNPQVGCVLVDASGVIVAEGWHRGAGTPHAEVDALSQVTSAKGLTAIVTLEPCNHQGLTGPCSEALISAGVDSVVFAVSDPGERSGGGAERLREAGVQVEGGVLVEEASEALRGWLTAERLHRPFVTVKWASSLDGRAAAADGSSKWITGTAARQRVHEQREQSDAILVGTGTVLADDPSLTARGDGGELMPHQPIPVVVGERAIPAASRVMAHPRTPIITGSRDLPTILDQLFARGIRHVFVEGGPTLASAFVAAGLVDEYLVYLAPVLLGGERLALTDIGVGTIGDARRLSIDRIESLGDDLLVVARPANVSTKKGT
ncbi:bifunctional diaminohydroxyphosphoribosylaminopyrimidine deaminase/5-amino-6-(5-phosphoribosylamino)uracil reductase RibD [Glaciihabitans sp. INWT7]|uniref:bifunctional diaminohydroxyphosphoribosylaminopyrimidine deaminase/5-amino-6-(5-phosphoribosylamino)uracil reductase RibD n=1 Tax=Glaciihabitans sp. INWT7 TaxID=2596912 RepID=UPI002104EAB1|nr:bifunctional diaminohydroxyphosphoribosylaminopyrimidine deaminase/5-amino-6-(5-phosphoribosylamino)uracil reductase RibD [Glaciihabitans sp. INWT7]